jgi:hypothetical protein
MTEEETKAAAQAAEEAKAKKAAEEAEKAKGAGAAGAEETVSKAEYDKLMADLQNFKRIEDERKAKEKKRQEELLAEQGKYKELYDTARKENETMKAQLEKVNGALKVMLDEEMKGLPEDFDKTLIPAGDAHDQLVWLKKAKPLLVAKVEQKRGDGTPAPKPGEGLSGMRSIYTHPTSPKH